MFWQTNTCYEFGPFRVDTRERCLLRNSEVVPLTPKVFDLLLVLVQNRGHLLTKDEVIRLVWPDTVVEEGNIARNISTLRSALGERPQEHHYIETVPWRGYRFVASVKEVCDKLPRNSVGSIAVMPLTNAAGDQDLELVADGITESLINNLSLLPQLKVMSRHSVFRYKDRDVPSSVVGKELNVQAVLTGRLVKYGNVLSISVELVDARDDSHVWGAQYIRKPADILNMPEKIAKEIVEKLQLKITAAQQRRLTRGYTQDPDAYQCYLKGRYYFNKLTVDGVEKGIWHLQQAVEKDPQYSLAYAALGDCYNYLAKPVEAKRAVVRALELDENLGEAHASLGFFRFVYDWDFTGAGKELQRALELNPNYAEAHHWSAVYLGNMGHYQKALVEARAAVQLDPLSLLMNMTPGLVSYLARDYDGAAAELLKVIEMDPNFPAAHSVLGNVYLQQRQFEKAMVEYQRVLDQSKGVAVVETAMKAVIAHAHARAGQNDKAQELLHELLVTDHGVPLSPHSIAEIYAALGYHDEAFEWLNKAYDLHDMQLVSLKVNPTLDPLRDDPRFQDLVRRMRL